MRQIIPQILAFLARTMSVSLQHVNKPPPRHSISWSSLYSPFSSPYSSRRAGGSTSGTTALIYFVATSSASRVPSFRFVGIICLLHKAQGGPGVRGVRTRLGGPAWVVSVTQWIGRRRRMVARLDGKRRETKAWLWRRDEDKVRRCLVCPVRGVLFIQTSEIGMRGEE